MEGERLGIFPLWLLHILNGVDLRAKRSGACIRATIVVLCAHAVAGPRYLQFSPCSYDVVIEPRPRLYLVMVPTIFQIGTIGYDLIDKVPALSKSIPFLGAGPRYANC